MRDLHLSVRLSNTITAFCLTFLADPPEVNQVRNITLSDMRFTLRHVTRRHKPTLFNPSQVPCDHLQYIRSMIHTLNRSTNLLFQHFPDEKNSLLSFRTPTHFSNLTDNFYDAPPAKPMETRCAVGLIYALRLYYITHHRHTQNGLLLSRALYQQHLYKITREIKSTAAALSLFPARTTFRTMPRFLNHAFFEANLFPLPPDGSLNHCSVNCYRQKAFAEFKHATPYVINYANSFQLDNAERRSVALRTAQDIVCLGCFLINFLPHFEYVLYRVVQLITPKDPTGILPMNHPPTNVVIFQGSPPHANFYMPSSSTQAANPTPRAGIFTINTNHDHLPIIINSNGESYNRVTVQALFQTQHARLILAHHIGDPDWIPRTAADQRRNFDTDMYQFCSRSPARPHFLGYPNNSSLLHQPH
jgi:hypothetical protein